jgi:hypothetical protein
LFRSPATTVPLRPTAGLATDFSFASCVRRVLPNCGSIPVNVDSAGPLSHSSMQLTGYVEPVRCRQEPAVSRTTSSVPSDLTVPGANLVCATRYRQPAVDYALASPQPRRTHPVERGEGTNTGSSPTPQYACAGSTSRSPIRTGVNWDRQSGRQPFWRITSKAKLP